MKRKRFTEEQIIGILKRPEAGAVGMELCRKHGKSSATYDAWKAEYGGLEVSEAKRLWADDYNAERPHSSLGYATPAAFAREIETDAIVHHNNRRSLVPAR